MKILSTNSAQYYYDKLAEIEAEQEKSPKDRFTHLRGVLDDLFKEMTINERQYFADTYSRSVFIFNKFQVSPELKEEVHGFRIRANNTIHTSGKKLPSATAGYDVSENDVLTGIRALAKAVSHFSPLPEPALLSAKYDSRPELTFKRTHKRQHKHIEELHVKVLEIQVDERYKNRTTLLCDADEAGEVRINLYDNEGEGFGRVNLSHFARKLWTYAHVTFYNLQLLEGKEDVYGSTLNTIIVLEPDYLIEAKRLSDCFDHKGLNPNIYFLGKFKPNEVNDKMMLGNLANSILDSLALNPKADGTEVLRSLMRDHAFGLLSLACRNGVYDATCLKEMKEASQPQWHVIHQTLEKYKGQKLVIEPTFFSAKYGIQGRLDIMAEDPANEYRKDILELKSGSAPDLSRSGYGLWRNNKAQVQCYNMLLESTFEGRTGDSAILYSKVGMQGEPLRNHADSEHIRQEVTMVRNFIVLHDLMMAQGEDWVYDLLNPSSFGAIANYDQKGLDYLWSCLQQASPLEQTYFKAFCAFVAREQRTAKIGSEEIDGIPGFAALWKSTNAEKKENFALLDYLQFSTLTEDGHVHLKRDVLSSEVMSNFREGDIIILYPYKVEQEQAVLETQILKGNITTINEREVVIALRSRTLDNSYFKKFQFWAIERDMMEKGFDEMLKGLAAFLGAPKPKRDVLLGLRKPEFAPLSYAISGDVSDEQRELIGKALSAKDYFLLQGPPGTGKTSRMLRNMVANLHQHTQENVVIMAFTNSAVEEISRHLRDAGLPYIRLSRSNSDENSFPNLAKTNNLQQLHGKVQETRIFLSTQASFNAYADLLKMKKFSTVIVDEASQLLEPHLVGILPLFERFILIGDDKQLPAVVTQASKHTAVTDAALQKINLRSLKNSLFYRLVTLCEKQGWTDAYGMLTCQGRMHADISAFVSKEYYGGKLVPLSEKQYERDSLFTPDADNRYVRAIAKARMIFVPAAKERKSKVSDSEARYVAEFIKAVHKTYGEHFGKDAVGVVTPYRSQIANIKRSGYVGASILEQIDIETVERFQGSERDVIIISLAVNNQNQMQFLESLTDDGVVDRKLNVALTRARKQVVVIGCEDVLKYSKSYNTLLNYIREIGGYVRPEEL